MAKWICAGLTWLAICLPTVNTAIGYFWHVTDFHYDANTSTTTNSGDHGNCWGFPKKSSSSGYSSSSTNNNNERFGNYRCDSPWPLVLSAVQAMRSITAEEIEFILWTGDSAARWTELPAEEAHQRGKAAVATVTSLLRRYFPSTAVYPLVGGADLWPRAQVAVSQGGSSSSAAAAWSPYHDLADLWRIWLPPEAEATFRRGGYYVIEQAGLRLHLVALNTNLYTQINGPTSESDDIDPAGQWAWLESVLLKARRRKGTVYIFGHVAPGVYEKHYGRQAVRWFQERFNRRYLHLVQQYSDVIVGQFFGHAHSDSFRIVYDETGRPVSWILLSPAVTPREARLAENSGANNPAIRLVKFNTDTGQVLDYTQYYLNLTEANLSGRGDWRVAYNFSRLYGMASVSAQVLHSVAGALQSHPYVFQRYYVMNSVMRDHLPHCGYLCQRVHYCAVTHLDFADFDHCVSRPETTERAAVSTSSQPGQWPNASAGLLGCFFALLLVT